MEDNKRQEDLISKKTCQDADSILNLVSEWKGNFEKLEQLTTKSPEEKDSWAIDVAINECASFIGSCFRSPYNNNHHQILLYLLERTFAAELIAHTMDVNLFDELIKAITWHSQAGELPFVLKYLTGLEKIASNQVMPSKLAAEMFVEMDEVIRRFKDSGT